MLRTTTPALLTGARFEMIVGIVVFFREANLGILSVENTHLYYIVWHGQRRAGRQANRALHGQRCQAHGLCRGLPVALELPELRLRMFLHRWGYSHAYACARVLCRNNM